MEYILNCSLGKDSVAVLIMLLKKDLPLDRIVFADVTPDAEFEETYEFKEEVERKLGVKIESVRSEKWSSWDDFFYSHLTKGRSIGKCRGFPPVVGPGCAYKREFKEIPLNKANGKGNRIYIGIAFDEAHRADAKMYRGAKNEYSFPLIDLKMTEPECRELCERYGVLHPLYQYFRRLGCWQCPKQNLSSLRSLYQFWPEKWAKLEEYQRACAWDYKPACRVEDLTKRFVGEGLKQSPICYESVRKTTITEEEASMVDVNEKTITEGAFIKITGCKVKNDNGIYIVDKEYDRKDDFCLLKVLVTGELSKTKYNIFFLNNREVAKNENITVEIITKEQLKQASAEVTAYLKGVTAKEKVYTFTPGDENSKYIKIIKPIHFASRMYGFTGTYIIKSKDDMRISFHLIGARGEEISCNVNNNYQGRDILFSLKIDVYNRLLGEGYFEFLDRIESTKGEHKKAAGN